MLANRLIRTDKLRIPKELVLQVEDHRLSAHTLQDSRKRLSPMVDPASGIERTSRSGRLLVALAVAFLIAAGLLLWGHHGAAVFSDTVLAALAWCF
jgi:hypothetical protein